tara:strand:- start:528 stop:1139 length:612 start_codon:yes stop_codon:yes gene_type:complete
MNWWSIVKRSPYLDQASLNYQENLMGRGTGQTTFQTEQNVGPNPIPQQTPTQVQVTQPQLLSGQQQIDLSDQQINPPSLQTYQPSQEQQLDIQELPEGQQTLNVNPTYNPIQPNVQQPQQQPQTQSTEAGGADSPSDDTDVGSIKENVSRAKQNLTQLPRGPKALQLTQILTDLSAAAIDPVNQRKIAIDAKNKLQQAFPAQS